MSVQITGMRKTHPDAKCCNCQTSTEWKADVIDDGKELSVPACIKCVMQKSLRNLQKSS